jgi:hypothetical protein
MCGYVIIEPIILYNNMNMQKLMHHSSQIKKIIILSIHEVYQVENRKNRIRSMAG